MSGGTPDRLARRYRRLLVTYPRAYRRERGAELLGALLDAAPPGRTRPTVREAVDLLGHGLRARLGRPTSRSVVFWALAVATIGGVFSAAFATRAAWETAAPFPTTGEAQVMMTEVLPDQRFTGFQQPPALFTMYGAALSREHAQELLFFDGGEYTLAGVGVSIVGRPAVPVRELAATARRNLRAHGWTVYPTTVVHFDTCSGPSCVESPDDLKLIVAGRRGDLTIRLELYSAEAGVQPPVSVAFQPVTPAAVYPVGVGAGLFGAALSFLVFGWASRRTRHSPDGGATVKAMLGFTLFFWWLPTLLAVPLTAGHHVGEAHPSWHPMWEWIGQPTYSFLFVVGCATASVGLAAAALSGRNAAPAHVVAGAEDPSAGHGASMTADH